MGPSTVSRTPRLGYARAFHCSIHRSSESRLPNEHNAWLEKQREEQKHAGIDANKTDQAGEAENGATKSSADSRKGGTRRRTRERRIIELPPPPPIPDWFLRYNVTLVKDVVQEEDTNQGEAQVIRCVDANTGHTLFTVPYLAMVPKREREPASSVSGGTRMLTNVLGKLVDVTVLGIESRLLHSAPESLRLRLVAWELAKKRLQKPSDVSLKALDELFDSLPPSVQDYVLKLEKAEDKFSESARANYSGEFVAGESPQAAVQQPELLDTRACIDGTDGRINLHSRGSQSSTFSDEKFFEPRYPPQTTSAHHFSAGDENIWTPIEAKKSLVRYHPSYQPISWLFLEAETSIRASLDLAEETQKASNFASSRIDLSLLCPDSKSHDQLDFFVTTLASAVGADVIRIDANDIEELMADYVGQGRDEPGSLSSLAYDVYDGYEADNSETNVKGFGPPEDDEVDEEVEYDESEDDNEDLRPGQGPDGFATLEDLRKALYEKRHELGQALQRIGVTGIAIGSPRIIRIGGAEDPNQSSLLQPSYRSSVSADMARWDDQRLDILLDSMLEAANKKRNAIGPTLTLARTTIQKDLKELIPWQVFRSWQQHPNRFQAQTADLLMYYLTLNVGHEEVVRLEVKGGDSNIPPADFHMSKPKTIVHIRDLKDITRSRLGDVVIRRLVHLIQKRRWRGESIVIVGTTSQANNNIFMTNPPEADDFPFRTITIPPFFKHPASEFEKLAINTAFTNCSTMASPASHRILEINLRHIQNMLRRMRPGYDVDLLATSSRAQMSMQGTQILGEKVLSFDQVQRLVLIAIGLGQTHMKSKVIQPIHFALATYIMTRVDYVTQAWVADQNTYGMRKSVNPGSKGKDGSKADENDPSHSKIASIRADCNQHESRLLTGVVDAQNIKTGFADVHAAEETIDALKTLTTLSLMRPDAFKYGVLANDRLPGLLLYGMYNIRSCVRSALIRISNRTSWYWKDPACQGRCKRIKGHCARSQWSTDLREVRWRRGEDGKGGIQLGEKVITLHRVYRRGRCHFWEPKQRGQ